MQFYIEEKIKDTPTTESPIQTETEEILDESAKVDNDWMNLSMT